MASVPAPSSPGRLVLFGTSRFIRSEFPIKQTNLSLFINMLDWSVQDEMLLQIRSKTLIQKPLRRLSDGMRTLLKILMIITLPVLSFLVGLVVWRRQKIRRALLPLAYREI